MRINLIFDIYYLIFENLRYDKYTLFSCVLLNKEISKLVTSILWKNPYISFSKISQYQLALLTRTYLLCINEQEKLYLKNKRLSLPIFKKTTFDYGSYIEELLHSDILYNSILYWILLEYEKQSKKQINNFIKNNYYKNNHIQSYIFNSLYHMFINNGRIKSLGISNNTVKILDKFDRMLFKYNLNVSTLTQLTIYLKDEDKMNIISINIVLNIISKYCHNIKSIKIYNFMTFTNQNKLKLINLQEIINKQNNLYKIEFLSPEKNIYINRIIQNFSSNNSLIEIVIEGIDFSKNEALKNIASLNLLKYLTLRKCKGISILNYEILLKSGITLDSLNFMNNEFSLALILSICKFLKVMKTNQLDDDSIHFIINNCINSLILLDIEINTITESLFYDLIIKSKLKHLKIMFYNEFSNKVILDLANYLPDNLKYLGLFTFKEFDVFLLRNFLIGLKTNIETLEIFGCSNCLISYLSNIKNKHLNILIINNKLAKCKDHWSCFDNNLRKRLDERTTLFKDMKEEIENFSYNNNY